MTVTELLYLEREKTKRLERALVETRAALERLLAADRDIDAREHAAALREARRLVRKVGPYAHR